MNQVLNIHGAPATFDRGGCEAPKGSSPFFGFFDHRGDPVSVRWQSIIGLFRDARSQKMVVIMDGCQPLALEDIDAMRLMKRMGWDIPGI